LKLIIQIPCLNEEESLPITLKELPTEIPGIDQIEWLIIDDGSTDQTVSVAKELGVHHIVSLGHNQGLAKAFMAGIRKCLDLGADIIVNTDADNQYMGADIEKLVQPILNGKADIVIGERPILQTEHFSILKKLLQKLGSWAVRVASQTDIPDAPSGFRAISRQAALRLNVFNDYTYTLETIIQAGQKNMRLVSVPIRTNAELRPSRLFGSIPQYIQRSVFTIGSMLLTGGVLLGLRYVYFMLTGDPGGHVQSLILAAILTGVGFQTILSAFLADLLAVNRKLLEELKISHRERLLDE